MTSILDQVGIGTIVDQAQMDALPLGTRICHQGHDVNDLGSVTSYVKVANPTDEARCWAAYRGDIQNGALFPRTSFDGGEWKVAGYLPAAETVDEAEVERRVQEAREAGRNERNMYWQERLDRFGEAARRLAERKDMCSEYDEFAEQWPDLIKSRRENYDVTVTMTVVCRRTVTAVDDDAACEQVIEDTGFYEGQDTQLYSEDVEIVSVSSSAEVSD